MINFAGYVALELCPGHLTTEFSWSKYTPFIKVVYIPCLCFHNFQSILNLHSYYSTLFPPSEKELSRSQNPKDTFFFWTLCSIWHYHFLFLKTIICKHCSPIILFPLKLFMKWLQLQKGLNNNLMNNYEATAYLEI